MDTRHTGIIDHASADAYLGRRADRALPGRSSRLERRGDDVAVLFHGTAVVTYHPDGSVTLDSGGWLTSTTKQRINAYTRAQVYQDKKRWWVAVPGGGKVPFRDGIRVDAEGRTAGKGRARRGAALRAAIPARPEFKPILRRLKVEAEAGARARGHALGRWFQLSPRSMEATCKLCGRGVVINARPAPNGIDISGSACGLNCHMAKRGGKGRRAAGAFPPGYVVTRPRDPLTNKILWEVEAPNGECVVDGEATRRDALAAARAHARDAGFIKLRGAARARAGRRGGKRRADVGGLAASVLQLTR